MSKLLLIFFLGVHVICQGAGNDPSALLPSQRASLTSEAALKFFLEQESSFSEELKGYASDVKKSSIPSAIQDALMSEHVFKKILSVLHQNDCCADVPEDVFQRLYGALTCCSEERGEVLTKALCALERAQKSVCAHIELIPHIFLKEKKKGGLVCVLANPSDATSLIGWCYHPRLTDDCPIQTISKSCLNFAENMTDLGQNEDEFEQFVRDCCNDCAQPSSCGLELSIFLEKICSYVKWRDGKFVVSGLRQESFLTMLFLNLSQKIGRSLLLCLSVRVWL